MGNWIDRDPDEMLQYVKEVKAYAGNMSTLMRTVEGTINAYATELDKKSQECVKEFHQICWLFLQQVEAYEELAKEIKVRADKLKAAREEVRF